EVGSDSSKHDQRLVAAVVNSRQPPGHPPLRDGARPPVEADECVTEADQLERPLEVRLRLDLLIQITRCSLAGLELRRQRRIKGHANRFSAPLFGPPGSGLHLTSEAAGDDGEPVPRQDTPPLTGALIEPVRRMPL